MDLLVELREMIIYFLCYLDRFASFHNIFMLQLEAGVVCPSWFIDGTGIRSAEHIHH